MQYIQAIGDETYKTKRYSRMHLSKGYLKDRSFTYSILIRCCSTYYLKAIAIFVFFFIIFFFYSSSN